MTKMKFGVLKGPDNLWRGVYGGGGLDIQEVTSLGYESKELALYVIKTLVPIFLPKTTKKTS